MAKPDDNILTTLYYFVDEAGDPTLFGSDGRLLVGTSGCSRYFILGKLEVDNPDGLTAELEELRREVLAEPYFAGVPSLKPEAGKTARMFHAKDDPAEIRYRVLKLLAIKADGLRFHAVVRDKVKLTAYEVQRREKDPRYRYRPNDLYDGLVHELFRSHHFFRADCFRVRFSQRGASNRTKAFQVAIQKAIGDFELDFGVKNTADIVVTSGAPVGCGGLQAVDYFMWALQRFYEHEGTDKQASESRYIQMLWPQVGEVHDLDFVTPDGKRGVFYTREKPLSLATRTAKGAKKKPGDIGL